MSTARDIVDGVARLIGSLDSLLQTQTVQALVQLVKELGIQGPVATGLEALASMLEKLVEWIGKLEQVAAIPQLLEELGPTLKDVSAVATNSGSELRQIGLDGLAPLADATRAALDFFEQIRQGAITVLQGLLPKEALQHLRESVAKLRGTILEYRDELKQPKGQLAGGTA
jgi:hypothetical protein